MSQLSAEIQAALATGGLRAAVRALNARTPHRFTGVYRYDGDTLRNVVLFDRWNPNSEPGGDAPMEQTFCAIVPSQGETLVVLDGRSDDRFPWMRGNPVVCYFGALIRDEQGQPWGTICHFDLLPCQVPGSLVSELREVAPLIRAAARAVPVD